MNGWMGWRAKAAGVEDYIVVFSCLEDLPRKELYPTRQYQKKFVGWYQTI